MDVESQYSIICVPIDCDFAPLVRRIVCHVVGSKALSSDARSEISVVHGHLSFILMNDRRGLQAQASPSGDRRVLPEEQVSLNLPALSGGDHSEHVTEKPLPHFGL